MANRGRPPADPAPVVFFINLRLYPGIDNALIDYLTSAPSGLRAQYVVRALKTGVATARPAGSNEAADDELALDGWAT